MNNRLFQWLAGVVCASIAGASLGAPTGYAVDNGQDLYAVDMTTATETLIGHTGIGDFIEGLAADPSGNLYATTVPGDLYRLDPATGAATLIGNHGYGDIEALDFHAGTLLGMDYNKPSGFPQRIFALDTRTGAATILGSLDRSDVLSVSSLTVANTSRAWFTGVVTLGTTSLFELDIDTGATRFLGDLDEFTAAIEVHGDTLLALGASGRVYSIDPISAKMTLVGATTGEQLWLALDVPEPTVSIAECYGTGTGGDNWVFQGLRFTTDQAFSGIELRMEATFPGDYYFDVQLRRSSGFVASPEVTVPAAAIGLPGAFATTPYTPVRIDFGYVPVAGEETFTIKVFPMSGPGGTLVFETFGFGNEPCPNVEETGENTVPNPSVIGDPAGFKLLTVPTNPLPDLVCESPGSAEDFAASRGVRFRASRDFRTAELRFEGSVAGTYTFDAELRRSTGFTDTPERVVSGLTTTTPGTLGTHPDWPGVIDFGEPVRVLGSDAFTLKLTNITGPGILYFETYGIGTMPCGNVEETEQNNVADPTVRGDPAGFRLLIDRDLGLPTIWCDTEAIAARNMAFRGIRFTTTALFNAIELPVDGDAVGTYGFTTELRRSSGFLGTPEQTVTVGGLDLPGNAGVYPYDRIATIDFGSEPVMAGTFTLKFVDITGPSQLFYAVEGFDCDAGLVEATLHNSIADPDVSGNPSGFRVLYRPDTDGDGLMDAVDNCIDAVNVDQLDADADGLGNLCDGDFNQDCEVNFGDLALFKAAFLSSGEGLVTDLNGDGTVNFGDLARLKEIFLEAPGPAAVPTLCP